MSAPARALVLTLAVVCGGLLALSLMARRYAATLAERMPPPVASAPGHDLGADVDAFVAVRRELGRALRDGRAVARARDEALARTGLSLASYGFVRDRYRAWRAGRTPEPEPLGPAFDRRPHARAEVDLGAQETLDP